jgi:hypothetical protein
MRLPLEASPRVWSRPIQPGPTFDSHSQQTRPIGTAVSTVVTSSHHRPKEASDKLAYCIAEAKRALGTGTTTLYAELKAGRLNRLKVGTRSIIARDELLRYLANLPHGRVP